MVHGSLCLPFQTAERGKQPRCPGTESVTEQSEQRDDGRAEGFVLCHQPGLFAGAAPLYRTLCETARKCNRPTRNEINMLRSFLKTKVNISIFFLINTILLLGRY